MKVAAVSFIVAKVVFVGTAFCMLIGDLATIISMAYTGDLKSPALWACGFKSRLSYRRRGDE